jgi:hypothetical protein
MYTNCDPDGHQYFIFDSIIDHHRLDSAIRLTDQTQSNPMDEPLNGIPPLVGNYAASGEMGPPHGQTSKTSKSHIPSRLRNMPLPLGLTMNLLSIGGLMMSSDAETELYPSLRDARQDI